MIKNKQRTSVLGASKNQRDLDELLVILMEECG